MLAVWGRRISALVICTYATSTLVTRCAAAWMASLDAAIHGEMVRISQALPQMAIRVTQLEVKVNQHLQKTEFS